MDQTYDQKNLFLMVLFLIIYLITCIERRYQLLPAWKRLLRVILLPVVLFFAVTAVILILQTTTGIPLAFKAGAFLPDHQMSAAVTVTIILVVLLFLYFYLFNPISNVSARKLDQMDGHEFEAYCAKVLKRNGFKNIEVTQGSSDYGADIVCRKWGRKWVIQCKRYSTVVGSTPVQEISAAMQYYHAKKAAVITNSTFTANAKRLATANDIILIDGSMLSKMSKHIK